jgi:kynurenine formamidase
MQAMISKVSGMSSMTAGRAAILFGIVISCVCGTAHAGAQPGGGHAPVTRAQYEQWTKELSKWGRWGSDDQKGALNLITPDKRKQAAALVTEGVTVSMANDVITETSIEGANPFEVSTYVDKGGAGDVLSVRFHGFIHTHIDAFAHRFVDGKMWNGFTADNVTTKNGAERGSVYAAHQGIFTRGVLMDMARLKGVRYLEPRARIYVEDLEAWERQAGVQVSSGDAVFIRTGRWARRAAVGSWDLARERAGVDPSVIPWLRARDVAILGSDSMHDAAPGQPGGEVTGVVVHDFALIMLGVHLFDNMNLEEVGDVAAKHSRWAFLLTAAPLRFRAATGSPLNPIAVF